MVQSIDPWAFWTPLSSKNIPKGMTPNCGTRPFRDPAFHETIVITVPLGHRGFFKYFSFDGFGSISVFVAFRCALFYTTFLSLVFIKNGKRQTVEPSEF